MYGAYKLPQSCSQINCSIKESMMHHDYKFIDIIHPNPVFIFGRPQVFQKVNDVKNVGATFFSRTQS